jgi:hypothetical protein
MVRSFLISTPGYTVPLAQGGWSQKDTAQHAGRTELDKVCFPILLPLLVLLKYKREWEAPYSWRPLEADLLERR